MKYDYVIIGGGIAGLSAAIRLTELNSHPLVIESGSYPSHKVCGEFFSPECVDILEKWDIHPVKIKQTTFHFLSKVISFTLPKNAGSLSHIECDPLLEKRCIEKGGTILTNTKVTKIVPGDPLHTLYLASGECIVTPTLIIATGRIPNVDQPFKKRYAGVKAHFEHFLSTATLKMFIMDGGYLGISPIENGKFNVAGLIDLQQIDQYENIQACIQHMILSTPQLNEYMQNTRCLFSEWMTAFVPEFGIKKTPDWPNVYFIGDAAGTIPPITGRGLSIGIQSGVMAAEFATQKNVKGFQKAWKSTFASSIFWGRCFHTAAMRPHLCMKMMQLSQLFPSFARGIYQLTR